VTDYASSDLDELCAAGEVVWRGVESVGPTDGRVAVYLADSVPLLAPPPNVVDDPLSIRVRELLAGRGAVFFEEIAREVGGFRNDVVDALWQLVWAGHVTNDTLAPLRSRRRGDALSRKRRDGDRRGSLRRGFRSRRRGAAPGTEGRWSMVDYGGDQGRSSTERQMALVEQLLRRYGLLVRSAVNRESVEGGFAALYPVLRAMEEAGRVRRGYFVAGMGGAQFAAPGADELLRRKPLPVDANDDGVVILAASDPANAYGAILKWPASHAEGVQPQRGGGSRVILRDGRLLGFMTRGGRQLLTFTPDDPADEAAWRDKLAAALAQIARRGSPVLVTQVDGAAAGSAAIAADLGCHGFVITSRGLLHRGEERYAARR
jgi:ATP-dependent Lhr-like helicase